MHYTVAGVMGAAFLALLPFVTTNTLFYGPVAAKFFYILPFVEALALVGAYQLYRRQEPLTFRGRWLLGASALFIGAQYLTAFLGVFPERSLWSDIFWSSGVLFLTHAALLAVLLSELLTERDWTLVRRSITFSAGLFALLLIIGVQGLGATNKLLGMNFEETGLTFGNETYAGVYLLLAFMVGCIEVSRLSGWPRLRIALLASVALTAVSPLLFNLGILLGRVPLASLTDSPALLLGSARASSAALLALLIFLSGSYLLQRFAPRALRGGRILAWGIGLLVGLSGLLSLLFTPGSLVQNPYIQESTAARVIVWSAGLDAVGERPLFGWGPENFNYAIERHFDPQLFLGENLAEIWFDRAHNVFVDTLVGGGVVGAGAAVLLLAAYLVAVSRARRRGLVGPLEAMLLYAIVPAHLLQLQTGFDTVASYTLLAVVGGYALSLERRAASIEAGQSQGLPYAAGKGKWVAGTLAVLAVLSFTFVLLPEYGRQSALPLIFKGETVGEQEALLRESLGRLSSFESLRNSSASFITGSLALLAKDLTPQKTERILAYAKVYEGYYQRYLEAQPGHYRARMNYAYLLLIMMALGENRVSDAKQIIKDSYAMSPGNPLTYILGALAELYGGDVRESDRLMKEALAINPNIEFTQAAAAYFEKQKKLFPNISVLKLTNL